MPNIVEYTNTQNIQPTDRGTEAKVQEGRRIGASFNQVAESTANFGNRTAQNIGSAIRDAGDAAVQYADHQQISRGSTAGMEILANLTTQWNATAKSADPNDPSVGPNFLEKQVQPALDKFRDGFTTEKSQQWAEHFIEGVRNHMFEKTTADMSSMAGMAVQNNLHKIANTGANTAMQDPSSVDFLLKNTDHIVDGIIASSPNLKPTDAARVREELTQKINEGYVKASAIGAIQKSNDPEKTAQEFPQKYPQYITGDEAHILGQNARQQIRARDIDQRSAEHLKKEQDTERSNDKTNDYLLKLTAGNPKFNDPITKEILNDGELTKQDKRNLINFRERELKPETQAALSQQTLTGLFRELRQPDVDTRALEQKAWDARLTDAGKPGSMTQPDFDRFRKELADRKTPDGLALAHDRDEFFKRYIATIDPQRDKATGAGGTALGDQKIYEATNAAKQQEAMLKAKGQDPHSLYDPASPNFFGKQISKYRPTLAEQAQYNAQLKADTNRPTTFDDRFDAAAPSSSGSHWWWPFGGSPASAKPPENREKDKVYDTPRGKMKWTGTGWVQP
jgi:hypothetical protein